MYQASISRLRILGLLTLSGLLVVVAFLLIRSPSPAPTADAVTQKLERKLAKEQRKKARSDYFHMLLRDPSTGEIPANIRQRELAFAKTLPKNASKAALWNELGPDNVGGRTRALAIDVSNPNVIIAGGVSGGIWKSTNGGQSWDLKTDLGESHSVTWVVQDPRPGNTNVWYHASGEFSGNSARANGANFFGSGIWKSTDNGETWRLLASTLPGDLTQFDHAFDFVSRLEVSPATGSLFATTNCCGLFRSTNGGTTFTSVLGGDNEHTYTDVSISPDGQVVMAVLSQTSFGVANTPGVYVSLQDGAKETWADVTPDAFPTSHQRSISAFAPSDPDVAYIMTFTQFTTDGGQNFYEVDDDVRLFRFDFDLANSQVFQSDRSQNLPLNLGSAGGVFTTQSGYNMILKVKPNDPDFVVFGATNLYRTRNAFTSPVGINDWIGGYNAATPNVYALYPNHHPDQHSLAFDPSNPNILWSGHDGGISTTNVTTSTVTWTSQNNGYNVTQFYHVAINDDADDARVVGGAQDNGTPFMVLSANNNSQGDVSSGDGAFAYLGDDFLYSSSQQGSINQLSYGPDQQFPGVDIPVAFRASVIPPGAQGQLFIHPFAIDPLDEDVIYYPVQNTLWRNANLSAAPNNDGSLPGWQQLNVSAAGIISALAASRDETRPSRLYYAASGDNIRPQVFRLDNATTAPGGAVNISIPQAVSGAFVNCIAVNPRNADEVLVVLSNYNIVGLFHSTNGGNSWTAVEGNLQGNGNAPGPSLRCATILPTGTETQYLLATSTGIFSTTALNGNNTVWTQEAAGELGNVVVSYITSRPSDGRVVAATHGRGFFATDYEVTESRPAELAANVSSIIVQVAPGGTANTEFRLQNIGGEPLDYSIAVTTPNENVSEGFGAAVPVVPLGASGRTFRFGQTAAEPGVVRSAEATGTASATAPAQGDELVLDDGDDEPDSFLGFDEGTPFIWANEFRPSQDFRLEELLFYMRTEQSATNVVDISVVDETGDQLASGSVEYDTAPNGDWLVASLSEGIDFAPGEAFRIIIGTQGGIVYPAGTDSDAQVAGQSFYSGDGQNFTSLEDTDDFAGSAFLIRAVGTLGGGGNGNPRLSVNPTSGNLAAGFLQVIDVSINAAGVATGTYQGSLQVTSTGGNLSLPVTVIVDENTATDEAEVPAAFHLAQNYPNPFNPTTRIEYTLARPGAVTVQIFDVAGRLVATLEERQRPAGTFALNWDGRDAAGRFVASGTYLYRLEARSQDGNVQTQSRSMVLLK